MKNRTLYIFIGPPGAGKGTLSQMSSQMLGWKQISTGNLCRKHIEDQTEIGKKIDFAIKSGKLVSDELIMDMIAEWFKDLPDEDSVVILDGYPRTVLQAKVFNKLALSERFPFVVHVVDFIIDDKKVIERLAYRFICENKKCQATYGIFPGSKLTSRQKGVCDECGSSLQRREDDTPSAIKERLKMYHQHDQEIVDFFKKNGYMVHKLLADNAPEILFHQLKHDIGMKK